MSAIVGYVVSLWLLDQYTGGDQIAYINFYEKIQGVDLLDVPEIQRAEIGGAEPLYGVVMWAGSNWGVPKNIYISFFNAAMIFGILALLGKFRAPWFVGPLLLSNFYFLVLLTSAERLKFGFIVLIFALLFNGWVRLYVAAVSLLFHFQMLGVLASSVVDLATKTFSGLQQRARQRAWFGFMGALAVVCVFAWFFQADISDKLGVYRRVFKVEFLLNIAVLVVVGLVSLRWRVLFLLRMTPILFGVAYLGPDRVNMIGVILYLYQILEERQTKQPAFVVLMVYFSLKSIAFIESIVEYRDGFVKILGN